jgi:integrase
MAPQNPASRSTALNRLSAAFVRQAKSAGVHLDSGGLRFQVTRSGGRRWFVRVTIGGKVRDVALGKADIVSLAEARAMAGVIRAAAAAGRDPADAIREHRDPAHPTTVAVVAAPTFRDAWDAYWSLKAPQLASDKNRMLWVGQMETYVLNAIGNRPVADIRTSEIIELLRPIWTTKSETSRKLLQRIDALFTTAAIREWRERASPCVGVAQELGRRRTEVRHFAAMHFDSVPIFLRELRTRGGLLSSRQCLEFLILSGVRSGEARGARWSEIDLDNRVWTIPGTRMKMGVAHAVPLTGRAIEILAEARTANPSSALLFPGTRGQQLSDMTLLKRLRDMGLGGKATVHGFCSSFKNFCAETGVRDEVSEFALAHADRNAVRAAYRRTNYLVERRELMQRWADHCCGFPQTPVAAP